MSEVVVSKNATTTPGHAKTLADIVSEIHKIAERFHEDYLSDPVEFEGYERIANEFSTLANEIEEAARQDCEDAERRGNHAATKAICETIEKVGPLYDAESVGNAVKLREALVLALSLLDLKEGVPYKTVSQKDLDFMKDALAIPARECDVFESELRADDLHAAFVKHCDECDCPMGCIHRRLPTRQDSRDLPILKCFARFVLSKKSTEATA